MSARMIFAPTLILVLLNVAGRVAAEDTPAPPSQVPPKETVADPTAQLLDAVGKGDLDAVQKALADDADPNATNAGGYAALVIAADRGFVDVARALIDHGAKVNPSDQQCGVTPLH